jgi:Xaa-Pro dipeptidase
VSGEALRRGELVSLVVEVYAWNYQVAVERPLVVGEPTALQRRYLETVGGAHEAAIGAVRPDATFGSVDRAAREVLLAAGYDRIHCGAGLIRGLVTEWQGRIEAGNLRAYNDARLRPNMVVTVEPWAQVEGVGGSRHCDVVRVTGEGHEVLSTRHRGVVVIG